jgi:2-methylcitrate dehydratase PrpD
MPIAETMTIAETLAGHIAGVRYDALAGEARHWAKVAIMDTVGCILAGAMEPCARIAAQVATIGGASGHCTVFGTGDRVGPLDAAAINGTAAHALDYDDCSDTLGGHPSAPILPALFAVAETRGSDGQAFIAAYIAGWETETRIARGVNFHHYEKGWHPTATIGVFGAAAACAKLLGMSVEKTARALALAASFASGLKANFGTMTKPLHAGHAARNGLYAALLAAEEFTSSTDAIEHGQGFLRVFNGDGNFDIAPIVEPWGNPWDIVDPGLAIKQYPCCGSTHPAIDAMLMLVRENDLTPSMVSRIESRTHPRRLAHTDRPDPKGALDAKFSVQYCLARALVSREVSIEHFEDGRYDEPEVRSVLARVAALAWPDRNMALSEHFGADVRVTLTDGRVLTKSVPRPLGRGPSIPLPPERLRRKFIDCARRVLSAEAANRLHRLLDTLETLDRIGTLTEATIPRTALAAE